MLHQKLNPYLAALTITIIASSATYWLMWQSATMEAEDSLPVAVRHQSSSTTSPSLDISGWKTYRNERYGFSFSYPPYFHFVLATSTSDGSLPGSDFADILALSVSPNPLENVNYTTRSAAIGGVTDTFRYSRKDNAWFNASDQNYYSDKDMKAGPELRPRPYQLKSGVTAWVGGWDAVHSTEGGLAGYTILIESPTKTFVVKFQTESCDGIGCNSFDTGDMGPGVKQGTVFKGIGTRTDWPQGQTTKEDVLKLLSTFTITSPATTADISEWKTYRNERYGFEVRYPADLAISEDEPYNSQSGTQPNNLGTVHLGPSITIQIFNPGIVKGDYNWPERPCGEWSFGPDDKPLLSEPTMFAGYKTLYVTSRELPSYYCINYPQNPLVISFDQTKESQVKQIL